MEPLDEDYEALVGAALKRVIVGVAAQQFGACVSLRDSARPSFLREAVNFGAFTNAFKV
jgi:hypothetical protein